MSDNSEVDIAHDVLKRLALYLDALAGHVFDIEETVGNTFTNKDIHDELTIKNLQVLDFLRQSMEDLALMAVFFGDPKIRPLNDESIQIVSNKLKLKSTRALLSQSDTGAISTLNKSDGDIDLF